MQEEGRRGARQGRGGQGGGGQGGRAPAGKSRVGETGGTGCGFHISNRQTPNLASAPLSSAASSFLSILSFCITPPPPTNTTTITLPSPIDNIHTKLPALTNECPMLYFPLFKDRLSLLKREAITFKRHEYRYF